MKLLFFQRYGLFSVCSVRDNYSAFQRRRFARPSTRHPPHRSALAANRTLSDGPAARLTAVDANAKETFGGVRRMNLGDAALSVAGDPLHCSGNFDGEDVRERHALLDLYAATNGSSGWNKECSWNLSQPLCW